MKRTSIDINCDMGESYGRYQLGNDEKMMSYISSCNIACGFHGGDPLVINRTIEAALSHGVAIGAHPSYPDLQGFGRRSMKVPIEELKAILTYQISALKGMTQLQGGRLYHIKPHGALYNDIAKDHALSQMMIDIVNAFGEGIQLVGLANSVTAQLCQEQQIPFKGEFFADRQYENNGQLVSRSKADAVLKDPQAMAKRVLHYCQTGTVLSISGESMTLSAETICLHGDHDTAVENAQHIALVLKNAAITIEQS